MIEAKEEIRLQVDVVMGLLSPMGRGDVLTHDRIERAIGLSRWNRRYRHVMKVVMRLHNERRGIVLWGSAADGQGYRLLTIAEQVACGSARARRATRQHRRGIKEQSTLPMEELTETQRMVVSRDMERARQHIREARSEGLERSALTRVRESMPRPIRLRDGE